MLYSPGTSVTYNLKYLKDLPYTRLGKHVHLAASARMLVISTCLTCVDDDTVYLDGERRHAISFTVRMGSVPENGQVHVQKHAAVVAGPEPEAKSSSPALTSDFANGIFIAPCPIF